MHILNMMEDSKQRNSPDSSTNEDTKPGMTNNNNHLSGGAASQQGEVATRSSKNLTLGYKCPKGCKTIFVDESTFAGHLLSEHNVKLVVTAPQENQQQLVEGSQTTTTSSPLSSLSSPSSTPPTMSSSAAATVITKCPVCRLQVDDLPFHFATAHSTTNKTPTNHDRRSESTTNNNVVLNRRNYNMMNLTNHGRSTNMEQTWRSQTSPQQTPLVVVHNDAIKSEVLSYEEMESGITEADHPMIPTKSESPIKITTSSSTLSSRNVNPPTRVMPIFLPSQPLPASQLAIEECSNMTSQRGSIGGDHSPTLKNFERNVRNLPMTVIPTVLGNHRLGNQVASSSITMNGQANSPEALHDTDGTITSRRNTGMIGQPLSIKVEDGGAMNLSIKDSPRSDLSTINGVHGNSIPLPLFDGQSVNSVGAAAFRSTTSVQPQLLNNDSNLSSASMSDTNDSEGGQDGAFSGIGQGSSASEGPDKKRRRKQTSVPPASKDTRYWARRLKNNEAAKRSRDMRIQREKIIFDENNRLETSNKDLKTDTDKLTTENKELKLKMQFILEENARLQEIIRNIQVQQQEQQQLEEEMDDSNRINGGVTTNGLHYK